MKVPEDDESSEKKITKNRPLNIILWKTWETFQQKRQFLVIDALKVEEFWRMCDKKLCPSYEIVGSEMIRYALR